MTNVAESVFQMDNLYKQIIKALDIDNHAFLRQVFDLVPNVIGHLIHKRNLLVEAFSRHALKCFELMVVRWKSDQKHRQLRAIEKAAIQKIERLGCDSKPEVVKVLDTLELFTTTHAFDRKLTKRFEKSLNPLVHFVVYRAYMRTFGMEPYLELVKTADEPEIDMLIRIMSS